MSSPFLPALRSADASANRDANRSPSSSDRDSDRDRDDGSSSSLAASSSASPPGARPPNPVPAAILRQEAATAIPAPGLRPRPAAAPSAVSVARARDFVDDVPGRGKRYRGLPMSDEIGRAASDE